MVGGGPVAMAVEHGAGYATTQHSRKRFLVRFRLPLSDNFLALGKAANVQTVFVCRATTKTIQDCRESFLDALHKSKSNVQRPMSNLEYPSSSSEFNLQVGVAMEDKLKLEL
jgi:hypothetical protein